MSKKEMPKAVAEVLKQISEIVKEFNIKSDSKLVAKSSDDFLLKIYPKNYEDLFFQINSFQLGNITDGLTFSFFISHDCLRLIEKKVNILSTCQKL